MFVKSLAWVIKPTSAVNFFISSRSLSTTDVCCGKRNFRKFILYNRGTALFRKQQAENPDPDIPPYPSGERPVGYKYGKEFVTIPETIPEIVVPDLTGFPLKPYVSYRAPDVIQSEFTAQDLFDAVYAKKILRDYKAGKLDENGNSLEPSKEEKLTATEAFNEARKTGCDLFTEYRELPKEDLEDAKLLYFN